MLSLSSTGRPIVWITVTTWIQTHKVWGLHIITLYSWSCIVSHGSNVSTERLETLFSINVSSRLGLVALKSRSRHHRLRLIVTTLWWGDMRRMWWTRRRVNTWGWRKSRNEEGSWFHRWGVHAFVLLLAISSSFRKQESHAAARKSRDAASVLFRWSSPTTFTTSSVW